MRVHSTSYTRQNSVSPAYIDTKFQDFLAAVRLSNAILPSSTPSLNEPWCFRLNILIPPFLMTPSLTILLRQEAMCDSQSERPLYFNDMNGQAWHRSIVSGASSSDWNSITLYHNPVCFASNVFGISIGELTKASQTHEVPAFNGIGKAYEQVDLLTLCCKMYRTRSFFVY